MLLSPQRSMKPWLTFALTTLVGLGSTLARAQVAPVAPVTGPGVAPLPGAATAPGPAGTIATTATAAPIAPNAPAVPTISNASGLTAEAAAKQAIKTSTAIRIDEAKLRAAAAQVDAAWDAYLPKLTLTARYTRLSPLTPPKLFDVPAGSQQLGTTGQVVGQPINPGIVSGAAPIYATPTTSFSIPVILDNWVLQASLLVPLSDYVFRIHHGYESALKNQEALKFNMEVTRAAAATDTRVAFYNVLRARAASAVAKAAIEQASSHLKDLRIRYQLQVVTLADVKTVEAQLAAAQLAATQSATLLSISTANLHLALHDLQEGDYDLGEDLEGEVGQLDEPLDHLRKTAASKRPELKALDAQIGAMERQTHVVEAGLYPRLDGVANATYANPNTRIFPQSANWAGTWDVSLQLTWSPTDAWTVRDQTKVTHEQLAALKITRQQLTDALGLEVVSTYARVKEAEAAIVSSQAQLQAAEEAYRVRREQFNLGSTTSALLVDAETDLTRARLAALNSRVDLRVARAQLKKAIGSATE